MGLRDQLNEHPKITATATATAVLLLISFVVVQVLASRRTYQMKMPQAYYTVDDGKTFFALGSENVPPFDYKGKLAVHAYVFECGGKRFVGYVERYTPEAHKLMVENKATPATQIYGRELKRPGDTTWVKSGDIKGIAKLTDIKCPDGSSGPLEPIEP